MSKRNRRNPSEEEDLTAWYAKQQHFPYPDDLPIPRKMKYGPQTQEVANRYLDADYPLPGTFPAPSVTTPEAAWVDYLHQGQVYPGSKISNAVRADRQVLLFDYAASGYQDQPLAKRLLNLDHKTGFSPIFEFQYAVLNFNQWSHVLFFSLNGVNHILYWDGRAGWSIDGAPISDNDTAFNDFTLYDHIAFSLGKPYPVITLKQIFTGDPETVLRSLAPGPLSPEWLNKFGVRNPAMMNSLTEMGLDYAYRNPRNPDPEELEQQLRMLEEDYFKQPIPLRRADLKAINALRAELQMPQVDARLQEIFIIDVDPGQAPPPPPPLPSKRDPHQEARQLYQEFLDKEAMMQPHRDYCRKIIRATAARGGTTPVMPLAIMGTDGGPLLCDSCGKQIPLEGGPFNGRGAGDAWEAAGISANAQGRTRLLGEDIWCSFISGGVTFMQESNNTLRVYHGYESGCMRKDPKEKERASFQRKSMPFETREKLDAFLLEEQGIADKDQRKMVVNTIISALFSYDPGIGVNRP